MLDDTRAEVISELKRAVRTVEAGADRGALPTGVEGLDRALPEGGLALGSLHEFSGEAATGFVLALLGTLGGEVLWCASPRMPDLYPPGLARFGLDPDRLVVACPAKKQDALWIAEEAMKSGAPSAVVLEADFAVALAQSRRLQLAVEQSRCFGVLLHGGLEERRLGTTAARTRWRVSPRPGPGIRWRLELERNRGGTPGIWEISWDGTTPVRLDGVEADGQQDQSSPVIPEAGLPEIVDLAGKARTPGSNGRAGFERPMDPGSAPGMTKGAGMTMEENVPAPRKAV